jgi:hypothetical protein
MNDHEQIWDGVKTMKSAEAILLPIQVAQQEHDQRAHRDILHLDTQTRLKHMTLHFLKYAGKIASARDIADKGKLQDILVDILIICFATANTLNVSIGAGLELRTNDLNSLSRQLSQDQKRSDVFDCALTDLVKISGRMAKSIESTDHLERGDPRAELEKLIVELSVVMLATAGSLGVPIQESIEQRWKLIESKSIFSREVSQ